MKSYISLMILSTDRAGFVDDVSEYVAGRGLNIEESRAAVLGREFGLMLLVSGEAIAINAFADDFDHFKQEAGIENIIAKKTETAASRTIPASTPYLLDATSLDHPGIVQKLTNVLHRFTVNIESMKTGVSPAPVSGTPIFSLSALLYVPTDVKISLLRDELYELSDSLNIDISFGPANSQS